MKNTKNFASLAGQLILLSNLLAQDPSFSKVDPRTMGFNIPPGPMRTVDDGRVVATNEAGEAVTGRIYVEVGDYRIVMLPDGQLVVRRSSETTQTDRPFQETPKEKLATRLTATPKLQGFKTQQSRRYLYVYNTSEAFATAARTIIESMFRGVVLHARAQKINVHEPHVPLVVIMFATEAEYREYEGAPPGAVAYYNILTNQVVMHEQSRLATIKRELAIRQSISTIAHEGAHQILHNIGVQQRLSRWPIWLVEGLAEYFAPTTTGQRLKWKGAGQVNELRMFELEEYLKSKSADGLDGKTIENTVKASRLSSTGYASAWSLTHCLAKTRRATFNKFVNHMSSMGPLEGISEEESLRLFKEYFGDDLPSMEKRLISHLKRQPYKSPFAAWPHFVVMVMYPDGRQMQRQSNIFLSQSTAEEWSREAISKIPQTQRDAAKSALRLFPNRTVADRFRRQWQAGR